MNSKKRDFTASYFNRVYSKSKFGNSTHKKNPKKKKKKGKKQTSPNSQPKKKIVKNNESEKTQEEIAMLKTPKHRNIIQTKPQSENTTEKKNQAPKVPKIKNLDIASPDSEIFTFSKSSKNSKSESKKKPTRIKINERNSPDNVSEFPISSVEDSKKVTYVRPKTLTFARCMKFKLRGVELEHLFPCNDPKGENPENRFDLANYNFKGLSNQEIFAQMKQALISLEKRKEILQNENFEKKEEIQKIENFENEKILEEKFELYHEVKTRNKNLQIELENLNSRVQELNGDKNKLLSKNLKEELSKMENNEFLTPLKQDTTPNKKYSKFLSQFYFEPSPSPIKTSPGLSNPNLMTPRDKEISLEEENEILIEKKIEEDLENLNEDITPISGLKAKKSGRTDMENDNSNRVSKIRPKKKMSKSVKAKRYRNVLNKFRTDFRSKMNSFRKNNFLKRKTQKKKKNVRDEATLRKAMRSYGSLHKKIKFERNQTLESEMNTVKDRRNLFQLHEPQGRNSSIVNLRKTLTQRKKIFKKKKPKNNKPQDYLKLISKGVKTNGSVASRKKKTRKRKMQPRLEISKKRKPFNFKSSLKHNRVAFGSRVKLGEESPFDSIESGRYWKLKGVGKLRRSVQPKKSKKKEFEGKRRNSFFGYGERAVKIRGLII